jgi:GT2 family glycosyltransferase
MKKLSAVIAHWYAERTGNLPKVIDAFRQSTLPPDEILIWDNTGKLNPDWYPNAEVLRSPWNIGCKAKFLGALVTHGEYVYLSDNDLIVQRDTLRHMMEFAKPKVVLTLEGHVLGPDKIYRGSPEPRWDRVRGLTHVTTLNCRSELIHRDTIKFLLQDILFDDSLAAAHEDFQLAAAAHKHGVPCLVVPGNNEQGFTKIDECGVGMSITKQDEHYATRDALCKILF